MMHTGKRYVGRNQLLATTAACLAVCNASARADSIAWNGQNFVVDTKNVVSRSNIILDQPNTLDQQAMPLGNGQLGVSISAKAGLTAQLNRADTLPYRNSPGQVAINTLSTIANSSDFHGQLDLYNGTYSMSGGGITATAYVQPNTDTLIIDVKGADPSRQQVAYLYLWGNRQPTPAVYAPNSAAPAQASSAPGAMGVLSETWVDPSSRDPGAENKTFGSVSAISVVGRNVVTTVDNHVTIKIAFNPNPDGTFRVIAGAPHFDTTSPVYPQVRRTIATDLSPATHSQWWNDFWRRTGLIRVTSSDGSGEYMENLRAINLYTAAAERGDAIPGSQAGVGDLFSSALDYHEWDSAAFWHWNLRGQVAANLSSGHPELNKAYFNLYRSNLENLLDWTKTNMSNAPGVCVPETMRFNGKGIEYENWLSSVGLNCSTQQGGYFNKRTLTTGAEISHWVWQQYLATNDLLFLRQNYPLMQQSATFLASYQTPARDGLLHTSPTNAHETQWDVSDSTTDIAAVRALYPETIQAAHVLNTDFPLVVKLATSLRQTPDFPRTQAAGNLTLLGPSADASGTDVIAPSYQPAAENHNSENIGLEPIWPYEVINDSSPLWSLARRTYMKRPYPTQNDWNFDSLQAARLQLPDEVKSTLIKTTTTYQVFVNGLADVWGRRGSEFYVEQTAVVASTLAEALVQDFDGIIRIAPAVPTQWDFDGSVYVRHGTKIDAQVRHGIPTIVVVEPGMDEELQIKNPWPSSYVTVTRSGGQSFQARGALLKIPVTAQNPITLQPTGAIVPSFAPVSGMPASKSRSLGPVSIGLPKKT